MKLLESMGEEFTTESIQQAIEFANRNIGTAKWDAKSDEQQTNEMISEVATAGLAGAGGAVQFHGVGKVKGAAQVVSADNLKENMERAGTIAITKDAPIAVKRFTDSQVARFFPAFIISSSSSASSSTPARLYICSVASS